MAAYLLVRVEVTDAEKYGEYTKVTPGVIEKFGGRFVIRNGNRVTLEGPEDPHRIVLIEFPSLEQAEAFYNSPEYQQAKALRAGASRGTLLAIEGV